MTNNMPLWTKKMPLAATVLLAVALLVYIVLRAVKVGFTHDESWTFIGFVKEPVFDLFFNVRNWKSANNHPLNSIFMQLGFQLFGPQEWALRVGSILGGLLFLLFAARTVSLWIPASSWLFFAAFCCLALNPFMIEFFALCRGYGLCVAFQMMALFYFFRWVKEARRFDLFKASCALGMGVLANFTLLDLVAAFFVTVSLVYFFLRREERSWLGWLKMLALPTLPMLVLVTLIFKPIRWIQSVGEFEWGPHSFWETWRVLIQNFVCNPFGGRFEWWKTSAVVAGTILGILLFFFIIKRIKVTGIKNNEMLFSATALAISTMFVTVFQHYLVGANYLIGRTAILFYPLLSTVFLLSLVDIQGRYKYGFVWSNMATLLLIINFWVSSNLRFSSEWWYDESSREAVFFVNKQENVTKKIKYGVSWIFGPATMFYQRNRDLQNLENIEYDGSHNDLAWIKNNNFDFIYVESENGKKLEDQYTEVKRFARGVVMRRK